MKELRVGIAGLGRLGRVHAANLAHKIPGAVLTAACVPGADSQAYARQELGLEKVYGDFREMVADPELDAVAIVSPSGAPCWQIAAALAGGTGETAITETIFDHRFRYAQGLEALGAQVRAAGETLYLTGHPLHGGSVEAPDLRGGAALTLAALAAEGESRITGLRHIDRGYEALEQDLAALGADIRRETL